MRKSPEAKRFRKYMNEADAISYRLYVLHAKVSGEGQLRSVILTLLNSARVLSKAACGELSLALDAEERQDKERRNGL